MFSRKKIHLSFYTVIPRMLALFLAISPWGHKMTFKTPGTTCSHKHPWFTFIFRNQETCPRSLPQHQWPTKTMECPVLVLLNRFTLRLWMGFPFLKCGPLNKTGLGFARKQREMPIWQAIVPATYDLIQYVVIQKCMCLCIVWRHSYN